MFRFATGIILALLVGYGVIKAFPLIRGPFITIDSPSNYTTSPEGFVTVSGTAHNTEALILNDGPLPIDPAGRFSTTLLWAPRRQA